mmetsp:Transcript_12747/g.29360  ORF Transcript_12747/g.29360 Transcript_12747/m.29360 type:complete len:228 (+) Transcript_12747:44-727(+)
MSLEYRRVGGSAICGVGVSLEPDRWSNYYVVADVLQGSPAAAHVSKGDVLLGLDGVDVAGMSAPLLREMVLGEEGSSVKLHLRQGSSRRVNISLKRTVPPLTPDPSPIGSPRRSFSGLSQKEKLPRRRCDCDPVKACALVGFPLLLVWIFAMLYLLVVVPPAKPNIQPPQVEEQVDVEGDPFADLRIAPSHVFVGHAAGLKMSGEGSKAKVIDLPNDFKNYDREDDY